MYNHLITFYSHHGFDYTEEADGSWKQINQTVCAGTHRHADGEITMWYCPYIPDVVDKIGQ